MNTGTRTAILIGALGIATMTAAFAVDLPQLTNEEAIAARQELMQSNSATRAASLELPLDQAAEAAERLAENYSRIPLLFLEGSTADTSRALPGIWEEWDDFTGLAERGEAEALMAAELARAGDKAGFDALMAGLPCGECHDRFRAP